MSHILRHWREAATLLLTVKSKVVTKNQSSNFQVLMLKRSGQSKSMPNLHVFPGGVASDADFSADWLELYGRLGEGSVNCLKSFLQRGGPGSYMFSRKRPAEFSTIPPELAFRICAIRETFEEAGILLVRDADNLRKEPITESSQPLSGNPLVLSDSVLKPWREKVYADASQFLLMCKALDMVPDVWSLYEWSNWLTPILPSGGRRYDTIFYICVLDCIPNADHCVKETTEAKVRILEIDLN